MTHPKVAELAGRVAACDTQIEGLRRKANAARRRAEEAEAEIDRLRLAADMTGAEPPQDQIDRLVRTREAARAEVDAHRASIHDALADRDQANKLASRVREAAGEPMEVR